MVATGIWAVDGENRLHGAGQKYRCLKPMPLWAILLLAVFWPVVWIMCLLA